MQREHWFLTPIWYDYTEFDFNEVSRKCLRLRASNYPNRVLSNDGGWQSCDVNLAEHSELLIVKHILEKKISEISRDIDPNLVLELDNVWININDPGNSNKTHVHPASAFSGTIYISVNDDSGKIIFYNDMTPQRHYPFVCDKFPLFSKQVMYIPKNGMIVIFPSWISHNVEKNMSNTHRISISFNVQQKRD
jgi:uncharacterized protein (TIGR02466 family)